jgi:hypothetical protein
MGSLFLIYYSIVILAASVALLTHKEPESKGLANGKLDAPPRRKSGERNGKKAGVLQNENGARRPRIWVERNRMPLWISKFGRGYM